MRIPEELLKDIRNGNCVAFVGAGFSAAAALPSWPHLLGAIVDMVPEAELQAYLRDRLTVPTADRNEEVAQLLERALGRPRFMAALRAKLEVQDVGDTMRRRLALLNGIPFKAVLTTNFDGILPGDVATPTAYRKVLSQRHNVHSLFAQAMRDDAAEWHSPIIKLHGDLAADETIVLSRLDYRRRLFRDMAYFGFLRSVFLYNTVLYLGFSFTDAYINHLRSETLEMLGHGTADAPRSYALINDVPPITRQHLRETESIEVLTYDTRSGDYSGFDTILEQIHDATNPLAHFGRLLSNKRILWVDPSHASVAPVTDRVLPESARRAGCPPCIITFAPDANEAINRLEDGSLYDLIVSRWGHTAPGGPTALQILSHVRRNDIKVPLIVFASGGAADENKTTLLQHGGVGYYYTWDGLLRGFEHVFASGRQTG